MGGYSSRQSSSAIRSNRDFPHVAVRAREPAAHQADVCCRHDGHAGQVFLLRRLSVLRALSTADVLAFSPRVMSTDGQSAPGHRARTVLNNTIRRSTKVRSRYQEVYARSLRNPRRLLAGGGAGRRLDRAYQEDLRSLERRLWPLVCGRRGQHLQQRAGPSCRRRPRPRCCGRFGGLSKHRLVQRYPWFLH
jgi:hypothetical protein